MAEPTHPPENELNEKIAEAQKEIAAKNNGHPEAHGEHKEEKKPISTLESVVNETTHGIGNAFKLGMAGLIPYSSGVLFPHFARDTALLSASQIAGDATTDRRRNKKYTSGNLLESAIIGTALAPPLTGLFELVHKIPLTSTLGYVGQAAAWGLFAYPAYFALYQFVNYTVRNKTVKGVGKYMKENYWKSLKHGWKTLYPFSVVNLLFAPAWLNIPIAATLSYLLTLFGAPKKDEVKEKDKRDKTPYYVAAPSVIGKLGKSVFYGVPSAAYAIGNSLYNGLKKLYTGPAKAASPSPVPAGAHP